MIYKILNIQIIKAKNYQIKKELIKKQIKSKNDTFDENERILSKINKNNVNIKHKAKGLIKQNNDNVVNANNDKINSE